MTKPEEASASAFSFWVLVISHWVSRSHPLTARSPVTPAAPVLETMSLPDADPVPSTPPPRRFGRSGRGKATEPAVADTGAFLLPDPATPGGWQLARRTDPTGATPAAFPTLAEAAGALAPEEDFTLALPLDLGVVARYRLPDAPAEDLADMARIQLEKVLPYAEDELGLACVPLGPASPEGEVSVAAYAVHRRRLAELCAPLAALGRWPRRTVFAVQVRAAATAGEADGETLLAFPEWGRVAVAVLEDGRPTFAQTLPAELLPGDLAGELPPLLLGAELEGVPTDFRRVAVSEDLPGAWAGAFAAALSPVPVGTAVPRLGPTAGDPVDLSLPGWSEGRRRAARAGKLRQRLWWVAGVYLLLLILGFAHLARLRYLRDKYDRVVREAQKPIATMEAARKHWQALTPAFDHRLSAVEILDQVRQCLPADEKVDLRLTLFEINRLRSPGVLTVSGEAPSYQAATDLGDRLKNKAELRTLQLAPETPVILPNGRASFRVIGRLP